MDLLVEKLDGNRYYLSQYKVLITEFEESAPTVTRNNMQLDQRNGNIDFGGWHTDKTIDITGYYRADDMDEEEALREKLYALLSDPDGYYITQLKTTPNVAMERPGETSGGYYDKLSDYPSHKRFLVYTEAPDVELVGNVNGTLLYKLTAEFKTLKLPYGETPVRNVVLNDNKTSAVGTNLLRNSRGKFQPNRSTTDNSAIYFGPPAVSIYMTQGQQYTVHADASSGLVWSGTHNPTVESNNAVLWLTDGADSWTIISDANTGTGTTFTWNKPSGTNYLRVNTYQPNNSGYVENVKIEKGSKATDWCPNPEDPEYNSWRYSLTGNVSVPYSGTVPCNQLEQGFTVQLTAKGASSSLSFKIDDTELTYSGSVASGDVFMFSGFSYTQNGLSIVSKTNKAYFVLQPDKPNKITCNVPGIVRILGFQNLYA